MVYIPHTVLSFRGTFGNTDSEQWSIGLHLGGSGWGGQGEATPDPIPPGAMTAFAAVGKTYFTGATWSPSVKLMEVRGYVVDSAGKSLYGTDTALVASPINGTGSTNAHPWQVALVATLTTAITRGPGRFGRVYLPGPAVAIVTGDGLISATDAGNYAVNFRNFLNSLNDAAEGFRSGTSRAVCVASGVGNGRMDAVTGIRVGRVLDTQRRRRRSLLEEYQVQPIT